MDGRDGAAGSGDDRSDRDRAIAAPEAAEPNHRNPSRNKIAALDVFAIDEIHDPEAKRAA